MHCQNAEEKEVQAMVKKLKMKFPVVDNGSGVEGGKGIPHTVVYDSKGDQVFSGHPSEPDFEKSIKKALKEVAASETPASGLKKLEPTKPTPPKELVAERTWTNREGKPMVAALASVSGDTGNFIRKGGIKTPVKLELLSDEDQQLIQDAIKAAAEPAKPEAETEGSDKEKMEEKKAA